MRKLYLVFLSIAPFFLPACTVLSEKVPTEHVVMFDEDGLPVDPSGNVSCGDRERCTDSGNPAHLWFADYPVLDDRRYTAYLTRMSAKMAEYFATPAASGGGSGPKVKRVLLFVHGGLNTRVGSLERVIQLAPQIRTAGYYPVFINWHSSLWSSYGDHLLHIRQGEKWEGSWKGVAGVLTAPVYLTLDVVRSVIRAPVVWFYQIGNDLKTVPLFSFLDSNDSTTVALDLLCTEGDRPHCLDENRFRRLPVCLPFAVTAGTENPVWRDKNRFVTEPMTFSTGDDFRECPEMSLAALSYVLTLPAKLMIGPVLDVAGTASWGILQRRTRMLFQTDSEFHPASRPAGDAGAGAPHFFEDSGARGGLSLFLEYLAGEIERDRDSRWELTVVGHSMGAIVLNEVIRRFGVVPPCPSPDSGSCQGSRLPIKQIVYMAAAGSVQDYESSVFPYLRRTSGTTFYNLMLHREAEVGERFIPYLDPAPRGSLLVWIDNFLSNPLTHNDRMLGRFDNFMVALHDVPVDLRPRIKVKVFSAGDARADTSPQKHTHFSERFKFWDDRCWEPGSALQPECLTEEK